VADRSSSVSGVAERYASALFDLAREQHALDFVEADLKSFRQMLDESADLRRLVLSPVFSAEDQERAVATIAERAGILGLVGNFLRLVARNRRLFALPGMITAFLALLAEHRGETTAQVVTARPLDPGQMQALRAALREKLGRDVILDQRVDPGILGGLIVKVGSRMIDTSLRTKLNTLKTRLKEAS
jgi:F-type H+-transporting ATPase subunit delta